MLVWHQLQLGNEVGMTSGAPHPEFTAGLVQSQGDGASDDLQELLTVEELATLLKVSRSWVYEHTRSRGVPRSERLPHVKIGKYVRFNARLVREFLLKRTRMG
jgi:excisionase family DNA binding protein